MATRPGFSMNSLRDLGPVTEVAPQFPLLPGYRFTGPECLSPLPLRGKAAADNVTHDLRSRRPAAVSDAGLRLCVTSAPGPGRG